MNILYFLYSVFYFLNNVFCEFIPEYSLFIFLTKTEHTRFLTLPPIISIKPGLKNGFVEFVEKDLKIKIIPLRFHRLQR